MIRTTTMLMSFVFMLFVGMNAHAIADELPQPQQMVVDGTNDLINGLVKQRDAIKQDRAVADRLVADHVLPFIDFGKTSQLVLGKYWRRANDEQRSRFTTEFKQFLINNYTTAMVEFTDSIVRNAKHLKYMPMRSSDDKYADVRMDITLPDRQPVQVNYSLIHTEQGWKIYDIAIEGVSLATTYRSQFSSEIRRSSIDHLIGRLADRNEQRAQKTAVTSE